MPETNNEDSTNESIESYYYGEGGCHEFSETGSPDVESYYAGEDGH